jgi:hypothetical protein
MTIVNKIARAVKTAAAAVLNWRNPRFKLSPPSDKAAAADKAVRNILSDNTKIRKTPNGASIINAGISLAPSKRSGVVNVCPHATRACILACVLWFAGRTVTATVRAAATKRTRLWAYWPQRFYQRLNSALVALARRAAKKGARAFCRLNTASDIAHPAEIMRMHPDVTFYDYTACAERCRRYARGEYPANYHLSFSVKESTDYRTAREMYDLGVNMIVVFDSYYFGPRHRYGLLPKTVEFFNHTTGEWFAMPVVDGDISDVRTPEFDGKGVCVGLRLKGGRKAKQTAIELGFAKPFPAGQTWFVDELRQDGTAVIDLAWVSDRPETEEIFPVLN